jgi:hypothetical protein
VRVAREINQAVVATCGKVWRAKNNLDEGNGSLGFLQDSKAD